MNYDAVFNKVKEQHAEIHEWMQRIDVAIDVLLANNTTNTTKIDKTLKRMARIEEKLNIVNIEGE